jgi:3-oxoacyl-[acyl-carrier protein] reductase
VARIAAVIGGTRRIGRWVSEALLVAGHAVHAVYRRDTGAARAFAAELKQGGYALHVHQADVEQEAEARDVIGAIAEAQGGLDTLVHCAGASLSGAIMASRGEDMERVWKSNVLAVHHTISAAVPYLRLAAEAGGRIVLFLSAGADSGKAFRDVPVYAACKAMLASYARSLARELAGAGITVNCIALGVSELPAEGAPQVDAASLPSGRYVTQEDMAATLWYLTGPGSAQLTGSVLNLGGGFGL